MTVSRGTLWQARIVCLSAFGPYVTGSARTEQIAVFASLAVILVTGWPRMIGAPAPLVPFLVAWAGLVAVMLVSTAFRPFDPGFYGAQPVSHALSAMAPPLALMVITWYWTLSAGPLSLGPRGRAADHGRHVRQRGDRVRAAFRREGRRVRPAAPVLGRRALSGPGGIVSRFADLGLEQVRITETVRVRRPTDEERQFLGLDDDQQVIEIWHTGWTADDRPVEVCVHAVPASGWSLDYEWPVGSAARG